MTAQQIDRMVRAFNPSPGAYSFFRNNLLKIWQARVVSGKNSIPGEIVAASSEGLCVACGSGVLQVEMLQKSGGKKMNVSDFLAGHPIVPGEAFSSIETAAKND